MSRGGPSGSDQVREKIYSTSDADPLLKNREIHWLICMETYEPNRRPDIEGWLLEYGDPETCVYSKGLKAIVGFRGTAAAKDLYDDILILEGKVFPRLEESKRFVKALADANPKFTIELTGHSLGGALARETSKLLGHVATTFNAAAPPKNPVTNAQGEVAYHTVFDLISVWQAPNTIRIDKGHRPTANFLAVFLPGSYFLVSLARDLVPAHSLDTFTNEVPGINTSPCDENKLLKHWNLTIPYAQRFVLQGMLSGNATGTFPRIPGI